MGGSFVFGEVAKRSGVQESCVRGEGAGEWRGAVCPWSFLAEDKKLCLLNLRFWVGYIWRARVGEQPSGWRGAAGEAGLGRSIGWRKRAWGGFFFFFFFLSWVGRVAS